MKITLISGRMRGQWFSRCPCGWESTPVYDRSRAEQDGKEHSCQSG